MPATIDKFLGRPLNHQHNVDDILFGTDVNVDTSSISTITDNATADITHNVILVNAVSKNITVTLPSAALVPSKVYKIKKIDTSINTVTIDGNGSELIDGDANLIINFPNSAVQIVSNSSGWYIV